jgi:hypothetical protein
MADDPDALAKLVNETRRTFADAYERPSDVPPWEQRHPRQQALDREIAAAVAAAVTERHVATLKALAASAVPGVVRTALEDAAAVIAAGTEPG